ncbi:PD-(D/E)XK nuclease family protein [Halalkalibacter kiskunsagensis]|uniref:PD-(D/E)XK nuclease family protein n=1 Tax=Halalkalibacter kiskunsagensis TaxID=1548599 RepID=A0ABV6KBA7_9BACI
MSSHFIYGTHVKDVANKRRLQSAFHVQKEYQNTVFYVLPSNMWLKEARRNQPGLIITTFDDIASFILKQVGLSYVPLTEEERTLFFLQFLKEEVKFGEDDIVSGKARAYADTYGQIKRLGLDIEEIPSSLIPLQSLFKSYELQIVNGRGLLDPENILLRAMQVLRQRTEQIQIAKLVIDGYFDFSPLQALFIEALKEVGIPIDIYVPNHHQFDIVDQTVKELLTMGFTDERAEKQHVKVTKKVELVAASTNEEQWRGMFEQIYFENESYEKIGILLVDERVGTADLEKYAINYHLPINRAIKRKLSTTSIFSFLLAAIENTCAPKTKWEQLPLIEQILRLYQVSGLDYAKQKQSFLQMGECQEEQHDQLFKKIHGITWKKNAPFFTYIQQLRRIMDQLPFLTFWEEQFESEENVQKLKEMADEYKALMKMDNRLQQYEELLQEKGLENLLMTHDLFMEWVKELGEGLTHFEQRASKRGIAIHTWRDVSLFQGDKLYVVGMNEGVFPAVHQLSGYVQERDLLGSAVRFSSPTQDHFRAKQQAHFEQLQYVAKEITYTYVKGIDANYPLLPSTLLEDIQESSEIWTWEHRMEKPYSFSIEDQEEKIAFHVGKGYSVDYLPIEINKISKRLERLEQADEPITLYQHEPLQPVVSITALESYARCPFRYGMERILQVPEPATIQERVSPLDIGDLVHAIIEEVYSEVNVIGQSFANLQQNIDHIPERIEELFEEKWEQIETQSPELSRLDLELTKQQWKKRLRRWWQAERKHFWDNEHLTQMQVMAIEKPVRFELPLSEQQSLVLTGKADRVDRIDDAIVVYDYKSGQMNVKMDEVRSGLKLQLPLYAFAIRKELERLEQTPIKADGATYISLKEPAKRAGNGMWRNENVGKSSRYNVSSFSNKEDELGTEQFLIDHELKERIAEIWEGMQTSFPVEPRECSKFCQYRAVCRVTDEKRENANGK